MRRTTAMLIALTALAATPAAAQELASLHRLSADAIVLAAAGSELETGGDGVAATLRSGRLDVFCVGTLPLGVGPYRMTLEDGAASIAMAGDAVAICLAEGRATVEAPHRALGAGDCLVLGVDAAADGGGSETAATPDPVALPAPELRPEVALEPAALLAEALAPLRTEERARHGAGEVDGGRAAACLDSGGDGGETSLPTDGALPEHEIDRSWHRVDVRIVLEEPP